MKFVKAMRSQDHHHDRQYYRWYDRWHHPKGATAGEAVEVYSLLTIGDGLVSQIPALLISITAGIVVTRVASEVEGRNLAEDIAAQLLNNYKAFIIAAAFLLVLAVVPGLPTAPFIILAMFMGVIGYSLKVMSERRSGR